MNTVIYEKEILDGPKIGMISKNTSNVIPYKEFSILIFIVHEVSGIRIVISANKKPWTMYTNSVSF